MHHKLQVSPIPVNLSRIPTIPIIPKPPQALSKVRVGMSKDDSWGFRGTKCPSVTESILQALTAPNSTTRYYMSTQNDSIIQQTTTLNPSNPQVNTYITPQNLNQKKLLPLEIISHISKTKRSANLHPLGSMIAAQEPERGAIARQRSY